MIAKNPTSTTPILDCQVPLPPVDTPDSGLRLMFGVWFCLGVAILVTLLFWHPPFLHSLRLWILSNLTKRSAGPWTASRLIRFVASAGVLAFAVVTIHELGHLLVGRWMGFRFNSWRVGPLQVNRPFRLSLYRGPGAWSAGGATLFPLKPDKLFLRGMAMVAAGPAANIVSGCLVFLLPFSKGLLSAVFIAASMAGGLTELFVPFRMRAAVSDAARISMLLWRRPRGERWLALMTLAAELRDGVMPESLSAEFLAKAVAVRDNSPDTVGAHAPGLLGSLPPARGRRSR